MEPGTGGSGGDWLSPVGPSYQQQAEAIEAEIGEDAVETILGYPAWMVHTRAEIDKLRNRKAGITHG